MAKPPKHNVKVAPCPNRRFPTAVTAMNSPQPASALTPTPAGNILIVRLGSQDAIGPFAQARDAANDTILAKPPDALAAPVVLAGQTHRLRIPLALALAAMLWVLGTIVLLTLALGYRLLA